MEDTPLLSDRHVDRALLHGLLQGFRLATRDHGLDVAHTRLVLRALARWHAASSILLHEQPHLFDDMPSMCCEEHSAFVDGLLVSSCTTPRSSSTCLRATKSDVLSNPHVTHGT